MHGEIQSLGLPPVRHADRVISEMMRILARKHATLWDEISAVICTCKGGTGSPRAQIRLGERIKNAGAYHTKVYPGKRGRFSIVIYDFTGFDPSRDEEIRFGDPIPLDLKPWISCNLSILESPGGGRDMIEVNSRPLLFITCHSMSRLAQRFGARTSDHLMTATHVIFNECIALFNQKKMEALLDTPPEGWRVPLMNSSALAILKRYEKRRALICVTVIEK
jgi:hypothetical protein